MSRQELALERIKIALLVAILGILMGVIWHLSDLRERIAHIEGHVASEFDGDVL